MLRLTKTTAENGVVLMREFLRMEAAGGVLLAIFATLAMIVANSELFGLYDFVFNETHLKVQLGPFVLDKSILHWINDGLMAIFFFVVGLEVKREMLEGNLSSFRQVSLPFMAALGGILIPAIIYYWINTSETFGISGNIDGWTIPTATDIAFSIGVLSLLGKRVPIALKAFLLALTIFDDIGAIVIIAVMYTSNLDSTNLYMALGFILSLFVINRLKITNGTFYMLLSICLWWCVLKSGVHATLAGVVAAFMIPVNLKDESKSLLHKLEHDMHGFVSFFIMPLFAFANAGVNLNGMTLDSLTAPVTLGVALGLIIGKQLGVFGFSWLAIKSGIAGLPKNTTWGALWGVSALAGIGFTMSLFIASLGLTSVNGDLIAAKLGIIIGSCVSAILGVIILKFTLPLKK